VCGLGVGGVGWVGVMQHYVSWRGVVWLVCGLGLMSLNIGDDGVKCLSQLSKLQVRSRG
jgi:hypothetical protein